MNKLLCFLLGVICSSIVAVSAVILYQAYDIEYNSNVDGIKVDNVGDALDELFNNYISREKVREFISGYKWEYDYTGNVQKFIVPIDGTYKLEIWGAQGGGASTTYTGGYGGYSVGEISLKEKEELYIVVGGAGTYCSGGSCTRTGGYNGGGYCKAYTNSTSTCGSGGGATHIAVNNNLGELRNYVDNKDDVIIVAGGGGGANYCNSSNHASGGPGGGATGVGSINIGAIHWVQNGGSAAIGGSQTTGSNFGSAIVNGTDIKVGAGGGYFGGLSSDINGAGGGSGFIGNNRLTNAMMYCYNCTPSTVSGELTTKTSSVSVTPTSNTAKQGNGYAKITIVDID